MKTRRLILTAGLLTTLTLTGTNAARACKYCWSGENVEAADYARQAMQAPAAPDQTSGAFPLDATINQFQPAAPTVADKAITSAADLRNARAAVTKLPIVPPFTPTATAEFVPRQAAHYADAGLLGLAAVGGVFCWRTRRQTSPVR